MLQERRQTNRMLAVIAVLLAALLGVAAVSLL
jgi:hypothetical protein